MVIPYCERNGVNYLVRGIRNQADFLYEEDMATANALLNSRIETVYLRAVDNGISSTLVRTCLANGRSIFAYVPFEVYNLIKSSY